MNVLVSWIVLVPLLSSFFVGLAYLYSITRSPLSKAWFTVPALSAPFVSFGITLYFFGRLMHDATPITYRPYMWLSVDTYDVYMGFLADKLSIFMALFITFVGGLIHIYASAYMKEDAGYGKFFAYFNLFLGSMLLLVLADGPLIMFIGWEGVGLCSYLLISFYYEEPLNVIAGNKAFIVNRVGDMGFLVGLALLYFYCGDYGFDYASIEAKMVSIPSWVIPLSGVMLFIGAMGKSAQIPLYVWLPDAMAGPTPVSALIHAATMVTAGVYMVTRFSFLYEAVPSVGLFISYIGALSALLAAIIATRQCDIKKILAYSTMSQLGYMFMAVGIGAYSSALFHVFTHAFFKALLFMGAGALIVMVHHEQNIFKMGQMKRFSPVVYVTMLIATLAISGIPPFSGFFSKDEILLEVFASGQYGLWLIGVVTAMASSYYMFRLFFVVFEGNHATHEHGVHDVSSVMKMPLIVLAFGALLSGFLGLPELLGGSHWIGSWLGEWGKRGLHVSHSTEWLLIGLNILVSCAGIALAYVKFRHYDLRKLPLLGGIIEHKFYVDELYDVLFVRSISKLSERLAVGVDINTVDALVMGLSRGFIRLGRFVSIMQNANVRLYAAIMMLGVSAMALYLIAIVR
jgi:NADH-quinone oxidoreductase subunit L